MASQTLETTGPISLCAGHVPAYGCRMSYVGRAFRFYEQAGRTETVNLSFGSSAS